MPIDLSIEKWIEDPKEREEYKEWVGSLPAQVQEALRKCPGYVPCYRGKLNGHYTVLSYTEKPDGTSSTLVIAHGRDSFLPGVAVFGVPPEDLTPCGCGNWEAPTTEQAADRAKEVAAHRMSQAFARTGDNGTVN